MTRQEIYNSLPILLTRRSPFIITELGNKNNRTLLENNLIKLGEFHRLSNVKSPLALYNFISAHRNELVIIDIDFVHLPKNYLDLLKGAVCSSPDSGALWSVTYLDKPSFEFKGRLILCTN